MYNTFIKFVKEIYKTDEFIPLHEPMFIGNEKKHLKECIDSTFVSSVGKFVDLFEKNIAEYADSKYAIASVNGTAALHIALILSDVKQDDEVITQPLTFIATANAISYTGAKPVFLDVDKETGRTIKACVPMHTFGHPAKIDIIKEICNEYSITLIEDAAESLGSLYNGQHTGTFGKFGTLSFNGNKTITTGGGDMVLTNDDELAKRAKHLTTQAKVLHKWESVHDFICYNYRLPNINAALGVA